MYPTPPTPFPTPWARPPVPSRGIPQALHVPQRHTATRAPPQSVVLAVGTCLPARDASPTRGPAPRAPLRFGSSFSSLPGPPTSGASQSSVPLNTPSPVGLMEWTRRASMARRQYCGTAMGAPPGKQGGVGLCAVPAAAHAKMVSKRHAALEWPQLWADLGPATVQWGQPADPCCL